MYFYGEIHVYLFSLRAQYPAGQVHLFDNSIWYEQATSVASEAEDLRVTYTTGPRAVHLRALSVLSRVS
jgi:hypothetical protein